MVEESDVLVQAPLLLGCDVLRFLSEAWDTLEDSRR